MKKFAFACLFAVSASTVFPDSVTVNGIVWTYTVSGSEAIVTGANPTSNNLVIPSKLGGYPVRKIGERAFAWCWELRSIKIPNSVTNIGGEAFINCYKLTSIEIPNGVTSIAHAAFRDCSGLDSVKIPESVSSIGSHAFSNCSGLTSVKLPKRLHDLSQTAFSGCSNIRSVTYSDGRPYDKFPECFKEFFVKNLYVCIPSWNGGVSIDHLAKPVSGELLLPSRIGNKNVHAIGCYAFAGLTDVTSVNIPDGIKFIGEGAFWGCSNLASVVIPESVVDIGPGAFIGCNIARATYPDGREYKSFESRFEGPVQKRMKAEREEKERKQLALEMSMALVRGLAPVAQQMQMADKRRQQAVEEAIRQQRKEDEFYQPDALSFSIARQLDADRRARQGYGTRGGSSTSPNGVPAFYEKCFYCNGSGRTPYGGDICQHCKGTGAVNQSTGGF